MSQELQETSVEIMGKFYQIKCLDHEVPALLRSAAYLQEQMRSMRETGILNVDDIAVITALNVVHQLLTLEQSKNNDAESINQKIKSLSAKIEQSLTQVVQMELVSEE